jgi:hypothetical protein
MPVSLTPRLERDWLDATTDREDRVREYWKVCCAAGIGLALALASPQGAAAQNPVTAVDIALEPDATMLEHAKAANARLLKSFPKGMVQQFVRTDDLDKVFAAARAVLNKEKPTAWTLPPQTRCWPGQHPKPEKNILRT